MKETVQLLEIRWCVCQICEEAFFVEADKLNLRCPKCGNDNRSSLLLEGDEDEENRAEERRSL